jgi:hypothetical protein
MNKGGVGSIHKTDDERWVFKRYHKAGGAPQLAHLQRLVEIGREVLLKPGAEPGQLPETSVNWPIDIELDARGSVTGVLLPAIPRSLYNEYDKPRGLEFLILARANPPGAKHRVALLLRMAEILAYVNARGLVHGDVNGKNLVWSSSPHPVMYLIDCDGMVPQVPPPVTGVQAAGWTDPRIIDKVIRAQDHYSDWYALALAMYRGLLLTPGMLAKTPAGEWQTPSEIPASLDSRIADLLRRALNRPLDAQHRPRPDEWVKALVAVYLPNGQFDEAALGALDAIGKPKSVPFTKLPDFDLSKITLPKFKLPPASPPPKPATPPAPPLRLRPLRLPPPTPPATPAAPPPAPVAPPPTPAAPAWPVNVPQQPWTPPVPPQPQPVLPPLAGMWHVQIQSGFEVAVQIVRFIVFPNGQSRYDGFFPANPAVTDAGTWGVQNNQLILNGVRTIAGLFVQQQPLNLVVTFSSWDHMQLIGVNSVGEPLIFRRQA